MCLSKGTCTDGDILDTHFMYFFHNHIYHQITFPEMMVKSQCHSVMSTAFYQCFMNGAYQFAGIMVHDYLRDRSLFVKLCAIFIKISLKYFFSGCFQNFFRYISSYFINHLTDPPYIPLMLSPVQSSVLLRHKKRCRSFYRLR